MIEKGFDVAIAIVAVAGILVMTKPGSKGDKVVKAFGDSFIGALGVVTGQPSVVTKRK